jgi:hypothetical protein
MKKNDWNKKNWNIISGIGGIFCIVFAGILIEKNVEGWGWFLFCGILCMMLTHK